MTTTRAPAARRFQPIDPQPDDAPPMPNQSDNTLAQIRTELLTTFSAADWESYNHLVGWLRDTDVASHALKVRDAAPDFLLPDADGRLHSSEQLRRSGPLVLSFFRGGWCPFCTADFTIREEPAQNSAGPLPCPSWTGAPIQRQDLAVVARLPPGDAVPQPLVHAFAVAAR